MQASYRGSSDMKVRTEPKEPKLEAPLRLRIRDSCRCIKVITVNDISIIFWKEHRLAWLLHDFCHPSFNLLHQDQSLLTPHARCLDDEGNKI